MIEINRNGECIIMIKKVTLLTTLGAITLGIAIGVSANGIVQKVQSEITR